jgi:hypothetical protein
MKKSIQVMTVLLLAFAFVVAACEGPVGPAGEQGPQGEQGEQGLAGQAGAKGTDGTNGANGTNGTDGTNGTNGINGEKGDPAFPNGVSLSAIVEAGTSTDWVDITTVTSIDPTKFFTFTAGTIAAQSTVGVFSTTAVPYTFAETSATTGILRVVLPGDDWTFTDIAAYVFDRAAGTLTFTDVPDLGIPTFPAAATYAINRAMPSFTNGTYSYTDGSGIELAKDSSDTVKGSIVVSSNAPADFSATASLFGDLAGESGVTISWLGNKLYGPDTGSVIRELGTFAAAGVTPTAFTLDGRSYELRDIPAALTGGNLDADGVWEPYNGQGSPDDLSINTADWFMDLKFDTSGVVTFDITTNSISSADQPPLTGFDSGDNFYVLGNNFLYAGVSSTGSEVLIGQYDIDSNKLTFDFSHTGAVGGYGTLGGGADITTNANDDGVIDHFE